MTKVFLKANKDKSVRMGHPWIFSGAVARVDCAFDAHNLCVIYDCGGAALGVGYYNEKSAIRVRVLSIGSVTFTVDDLRRRIKNAIAHRNALLTPDTNSCRLVNSEGDFLPGLIVDRFDLGLCLQIGTAGMETWRDEITEALKAFLFPSFIYERSDTESRVREGLLEREGLITGSLPKSLIITENGVKFQINMDSGQKTGFFMDQRDNREFVRRYCFGRNVCDCFSYSGGFAVSAAIGSAASVKAVDISAEAGALLKQNALLNDVSIEFIKADVFSYLRELRRGARSQEKIDLLILDPPKFARHPQEINKAARGYKDINLAAMRLLAPDGILFTFSCSGAVDHRLFRQIVFAAAADSGRTVQLLRVLTAGEDHPINIAHREGEYLKGLVLRVE